MLLIFSLFFFGLTAGYVFSYIMTSDLKGANYRSPPRPLLKLSHEHLSFPHPSDLLAEHWKFLSVSHIIHSPPVRLRSDFRSQACVFVHVHLHAPTPNPAHSSKEKNQQFYSIANSTNTPEKAEWFIEMFDKETTYCVFLMD